MRWRHPKLGLIAPAELHSDRGEERPHRRDGRLGPQARLPDAVSWQRPDQGHGQSFAGAVRDGDPCRGRRRGAGERRGLPADRLELEITETVLCATRADARGVLRQAARLGVRIALDDFGTAFASLSYLRKFAFDKIKIDRSFVSRAVRSGRTASPSSTPWRASRRRSKSARSPKASRRSSSSRRSRSPGCNEVQGFYFSQPVPCGRGRAALVEVRGQAVARRL